MSKARIEILRLIAEGKISPEEGERMLAALEEPTDAPERGAAPRFGEAMGQVLQEMGETVRKAVDDAIGSASRPFEELRKGTESVDVGAGGFEIESGGKLRIQQAMRMSFGGASRGGGLIARASQGNRIRIVRGEAIEVHKSVDGHVLTWAKGNLEVEIPRDLSGLEVRSMGGDVEIISFPGPMALDSMGGEQRIRSPRSAFRCRSLGGRVRIADLEMSDGVSTISTAGGDVDIDAAPGSSLTVRISTLGGEIEIPPGTERESQGKTRRRTTCVLGSGAGELSIRSLGGSVRLRIAGT